MKTELILVGKTNDKNFQAGIDDYVSRIGHYMPFSIKVVQDVKIGSNGSKGSNSAEGSRKLLKEHEGEQILKLLQTSDTLVLLDERGKEYRSVEFASWLERMQQSARRLVFCIGGSYGFSEAVYQRANEMVSLSKMTFSHQMVRLVFTEQIYRACTIIKGEPYHHE